MTRPSEWKSGVGAQMAYDQLREQILSLELPPGVLLDDAALARYVGISRTTLREVLVRLSLDGLVEFTPSRPAVVSKIDYSSLDALLYALELMLRLISRLAAQNRHDKDLKFARRPADALAFAVHADNATVAFSEFVEFHMAIARAGRNNYFSATLNRLFGDVERMLRACSQLTGRFPNIEVGSQRETLLQAIWQKDHCLADECARESASAIKNTIQQHVIAPAGVRVPPEQFRSLVECASKGSPLLSSEPRN